jgi:hypothetical protein
VGVAEVDIVFSYYSVVVCHSIEQTKNSVNIKIGLSLTLALVSLLSKAPETNKEKTLYTHFFLHSRKQKGEIKKTSGDINLEVLGDKHLSAAKYLLKGARNFGSFADAKVNRV